MISACRLAICSSVLALINPIAASPHPILPQAGKNFQYTGAAYFTRRGRDYKFDI
jgi:hypothetical protein